MHLWTEMMLCVVAVKEPGPVVKLAVGAHAPRNRFVGIAAIMPIVAVQVRQAVAKVIAELSESTACCATRTLDFRPILARDRSTDLLRNLIISASGTVRKNKLW